MRICHCLFWKQNNKIAVIYKGNNKMDVLKIKGEVFIDYTEDFWELWKDYSGYCKGDLTDFCFIYDKPMEIPEEYQVESCGSNNSIWTVEKIRKVFEMLQLTKVMDIYDENNNHIMTLPNQNSKRGGEALFSKNINTSSIIKEEKDKKELTSFIKHNVDNLKKELETLKKL